MEVERSYLNKEFIKEDSAKSAYGNSFVEGDAPLHENIGVVKPVKSKKKIFVVLLIFILALSFLSVSTAGILLAYNIIPTSNFKIKAIAVSIVSKIPFLPKTALSILQASLIAHEDVSSAYMDISIASSSSFLSSTLGAQNFDMQISGPFDFSDIENPKANLKAGFGKEFEAETIILGNNMYAKLDKFPSYLLAVFGIKQETISGLLGRWVYFDRSTKDTGARDALNSYKDKKAYTDEVYGDFMEKMNNEYILSKISVSQENIDNFKSYKMHIDLNKEEIEQFINEIYKDVSVDVDIGTIKKSNPIVQIIVDVWFEKSTFYLRKMSLVATLDVSSYGLNSYSDVTSSPISPTSEKFDVAFSVSLSKIGESANVSAPKEYMSSDEFFNQIASLIGQVNVPPSGEYSASKSTAKKLVGEVESYKKMTGKFPKTVEEMNILDEISAQRLSERYDIGFEYIPLVDGVFIYINKKDPDNAAKPYYLVLISTSEGFSGNFTEKEFSDYIKRFGIQVNLDIQSFL